MNRISNFRRAFGIILVWSSLILAGCNGNQSSLKSELDLARTEGLTLTAAEFKATLPKIPDQENAALDYNTLQIPKSADVTLMRQLGWDQLHAPSDTSARLLKQKLDGYARDLEVLRRGTQKKSAYSLTAGNLVLKKSIHS